MKTPLPWRFRRTSGKGAGGPVGPLSADRGERPVDGAGDGQRTRIEREHRPRRLGDVALVPVPRQALQHGEVETRAVVRLAGVGHPEGVHADRAEELHGGPRLLHLGAVVVELVARRELVLDGHHRARGVLAGPTALAGERSVVVDAEVADHVGPDLGRVARDHLDERSVLAPVGALLVVHAVHGAVLVDTGRALDLAVRLGAVQHRCRVSLQAATEQHHRAVRAVPGAEGHAVVDVRTGLDLDQAELRVAAVLAARRLHLLQVALRDAVAVERRQSVIVDQFVDVRQRITGVQLVALLDVVPRAQVRRLDHQRRPRVRGLTAHVDGVGGLPVEDEPLHAVGVGVARRIHELRAAELVAGVEPEPRRSAVAELVDHLADLSRGVDDGEVVLPPPAGQVGQRTADDRDAVATVDDQRIPGHAHLEALVDRGAQERGFLQRHVGAGLEAGHAVVHVGFPRTAVAALTEEVLSHDGRLHDDPHLGAADAATVVVVRIVCGDVRGHLAAEPEVELATRHRGDGVVDTVVAGDRHDLG